MGQAEKDMVRQMAEEKGLGQYWPIIEKLVGLENSAWNPVTPSGFNVQGTEDSHGLFQLNRMGGGLGTGYTVEQLQNPELNADIALTYIKAALDRGESIQSALSPWANARNMIFGAGGWQQAAEPVAPAPRGAGLVPPDPTDPRYQVPSDPLDPTSPKTFDYVGFSEDVAAYQLATTMPEVEGEEDLSTYFTNVIDQITAEINAGNLEVSQAQVELDKRLNTLTQARTMYESLVPYALPEGAEWIPGGGPGGVYEKIGLGTMPATTTRVNPFAAAVALMGKTPEMGEVPETSFEEALRRAKELQAAAAPATVQPGAAPEPVTAAVSTPASVSPAAAPATTLVPATPTTFEAAQKALFPFAPKTPATSEWPRIISNKFRLNELGIPEVLRGGRWERLLPGDPEMPEYKAFVAKGAV